MFFSSGQSLGSYSFITIDFCFKFDVVDFHFKSNAARRDNGSIKNKIVKDLHTFASNGNNLHYKK